MWNKETNRPEDWEDMKLGMMARMVDNSGATFKEWSDFLIEAGADAVVEEAIEEGKRRALVELWE